MNCRWICFCFMAPAMATPHLWAAGKASARTERLREQTREALRAEAGFPFKKEELHALIREVALKIEEKYKGERPEADGLVQRVEETLAAPEPPETDADDRQLMLATQMVQMNSEFGFKAVVNGVRGPVFDSSDTGYMQRYQDLESASTRDAEEVWRWLMMAEAAHRLSWQDKEEVCSQRALGAARALVSREPKNAEAHALLGLTLEWGGEKLEVLQAALKLDPKRPLALHALMHRRIEQALEAAILRRESRMDEKPVSSLDLSRALYDRPLSEEEIAAYESGARELHRDLQLLLSVAEERADLVSFLKTAHSIVQCNVQKDMLVAASKRDPQESFEVFVARLGVQAASHTFSVFADDALLKTALKLAAGDSEATSTIIMMALMGDSMKLFKEQQRPKEPRMVLIRETFASLLEMAGADDSLRAARACEGVFIMEFLLGVVLQREPMYLELLIRAVHLDPFRQRNQNMLLGVCLKAPREYKNLATTAALAQAELALLPGVSTRRTCAAAAVRLQDWPTAHRLLDACLKEKPEDLGLLNQKAVIFLRESQSKAAQKKAEFYFNKIESLLQKSDAKPGKDDLEVIARDHILFLMIGGKNDRAREELEKVKREKSLGEKECAELEKLLP